MLKLKYFSVLLLIFLVSQGSVAKSQDNGRSTCLLQDPQNQCGDFCLTKIHPMIDLIPETNSKLERIHGEQQSIQMKLVAVQSTVEAQRISMQNSLKNITSKEDLKSQLQLLTTKMESQDTTMQTKLDAGNSELKSQLHYLQTNLEDQQKPLLDSLQRTFTKVFEERLNVTEEQLLVSNSELKTQLKEMDTNVRDQEISMQSKLDAQLLAVQKKLEDQNTALFRSFETRLNGTEGQLKKQLQGLEDQNRALSESFEERFNGKEEQLRMFETKIEAQLKEPQNKTENQLLALKNEQSAFQKTLLETLSTIHNKIIPPKFELIGSRYFYIEHNIKKTWHEAAETCRGMGGYLAAFKTDEELADIMPKLLYTYWTGIKYLKEDGKFISTASGKPATVFKWAGGEPNNSGACVVLDNRGMFDYDCSAKNYFICQSDNET